MIDFYCSFPFVFVLFRRDRACLKVLERNLKLTSEVSPDEAAELRAREAFLVENLRVSPKVIAFVKAVKSMVAGK